MNKFIAGMLDFLKVPFNRNLTVGLIILGSILTFMTPGPVQEEDALVNVYFFYLPTCPHCNEQKPIMYELEQEYPNVSFKYIDASVSEGIQLFYQMARDYNLSTENLKVPTTFFRYNVLVGFHDKTELKEALDECIEMCLGEGVISANETQEETTFPLLDEFELPFLGKVNLMEYSLPMLAIVLGLVDGFNPCAMWVLVYLIGIILDLKDRRRIWLLVGTFVFASGVLYFLFMTAWLNAFLILGYVRQVTIIIGLFAIGSGILSLKEYLTTKGALVCKVGDVDSKKKTMIQIRELVSSPLTVTTLIGIIALAFVVNSVEFACSSAIPAIFTQILAISNLSGLEYYLYILLYDLFFMLDDLIIFSLAAFAVTGTAVGNKYAKYCKAIGGVLMLLMGILLLFFPGILQ
jgi:thiol-disulfide isomerase/thioredoxin